MGNFSHDEMRSTATENEVAVVLSHFNSAYIMDVMRDKIENRFSLSNMNLVADPNIVLSFEQNFQYIMATYPSDIENIMQVRSETYREIIDLICSSYDMTFNDSEGLDYYSCAFYLYDFFVCNFSNYISAFFASYILANKDGIYVGMNLDAFKKSKDSSTIYAKKLCDDQRVAIIASNIIYVVENMKTFDITLQEILTYIYGNPLTVSMFAGMIGIPYDFFKEKYYNIPEEYQTILYTNIRLAIYRATAHAAGAEFLI